MKWGLDLREVTLFCLSKTILQNCVTLMELHLLECGFVEVHGDLMGFGKGCGKS